MISARPLPLRLQNTGKRVLTDADAGRKIYFRCARRSRWNAATLEVSAHSRRAFVDLEKSNPSGITCGSMPTRWRFLF